MTYLEELKKGLNKSQVAYQEFILHLSQNKNGLFCFFEGKDSPYYSLRIKRFTENYHPIKCGGKDKVLDVYRLISKHSEYQKYNKAFFIDRDFDNSLKNPDIFETPCYSIENFYTSANTFKDILKNSFGLSEVSETYQTCLMLYTQRQQEFHQATIFFNAWYACLIHLRNTINKEAGATLDDKLPKNFIKFSLSSITANYTFQSIQDAFPNALEVSQESLNEKLIELFDCEQHKMFRGKYEMQFVVTIIDLILQDSNNQKNYVKEKIKFSFSSKLSNEQAIELFSNYAETPDCLITYLAKFK